MNIKIMQRITSLVLVIGSVLLISGCGCDAPEKEIIQENTTNVSFVTPNETQDTTNTSEEVSKPIRTETKKPIKSIQRRVIKQDNSSIAIGHLIWKKCSEGQNWTGSRCSGSADGFSYQSAVEYVNNTNWRLPTVEELESLLYCSNGYKVPFESIDTCQKGGKDYQQPTINQSQFPNTPSSEFWSSSEYKDAISHIWATSFLHGGSQPHNIDINNPIFNDNIKVRLVKTKGVRFNTTLIPVNSI